MADDRPVLLILGSAPNAIKARDWPKRLVDQIIVINNAWRVRADWDVLVTPEDFPAHNMPPSFDISQRLVAADEFVPAQNGFGGFVHAGATMAYTAAYWALSALNPRVMAFMGCDMVYPAFGDTHFYGTGAADPLRDDVSLRDLKAKSARLAMIAAAQGCACVNLSQGETELVFPTVQPEALRQNILPQPINRDRYETLRKREDALGYATPDGRYDVAGNGFDLAQLDALDADWRALFDGRG